MLPKLERINKIKREMKKRLFRGWLDFLLSFWLQMFIKIIISFGHRKWQASEFNPKKSDEERIHQRRKEFEDNERGHRLP